MRDSETTEAIKEQLRKTQELWRRTKKDRDNARSERVALQQENDFTK